MSIWITVAGGVIFLYLLLYRPALALVVFFTMTIAAVNFDIPGTGIRLRPLLAALLLVRSVFDRQFSPLDVINLPGYRILLSFFAYILLISWGKETLYGEIIRLLLLSVVTAYLALYAFRLYQDSRLVKISIVLAGLVCLADLAYTYMMIGTFPVQRIYHLFFPNNLELEELNDTNHNFYGFICGIAFVLLLTDYLSNTSFLKRFTLVLLPLMLMGVLMSTSRSTLLGLIAATIFIMYRGVKDPVARKRTFAVLSISGILAGVVLFSFIAIQSFFDLDSEFINNISFRLVEEPIAVIRKNLGYSYDVQNLDAMDWRKESASLALEAYGNLPVHEQLTGVGIGGYLQRNLGHNGLNPHNGILYILVECGLIGFLVYFYLVGSVLKNAFTRKPISSLLLVYIFIIFYSFGQNEELISATAILFLGTLIVENAFASRDVEDSWLPVKRQKMTVV
ncbi:MAG TPA: O-antigen ligase family protein [Chitinophagaceae bacterium]|nr:O-antigen ligase family protein [Chitinophagaceae bacterium]